MKKNIAIQNNFKKNPNYVRTVSRAGYSTFSWKTDVLGLPVWVGLALIFEEKAGNSFVDFRQFAKQGLTRESVKGAIEFFWPWFPEHYACIAGHEMTWKAPYDRVHHQYIEYEDGIKGSGRSEISTEHLLCHSEYAKVREAMDKLLIRGTTMTRSEIFEIGRRHFNLPKSLF